MAWGAISETFPVRNAGVLVARRPWEPVGLSALLKNNTPFQPPWQEIVDFHIERSGLEPGCRRSSERPRDLSKRIPHG
jgi:hypothetical protein